MIEPFCTNKGQNREFPNKYMYSYFPTCSSTWLELYCGCLLRNCVVCWCECMRKIRLRVKGEREKVRKRKQKKEMENGALQIMLFHLQLNLVHSALNLSLSLYFPFPAVAVRHASARLPVHFTCGYVCVLQSELKTQMLSSSSSCESNLMSLHWRQLDLDGGQVRAVSYTYQVGPRE